MVGRHSWRFLPPPLLDGVQHVSSLLILGVTSVDDLRVTKHVASTLEARSRSLYAALWELRSHGLPTRVRHQVARATTVADLCFTSVVRSHIGSWAWPHWKVPVSNEKNGYLSDGLGGAAQLVKSAEDWLMRSIIDWGTHVLCPLCPPTNSRKYELRPRLHNFLLPPKDDTNYIPQTLLRLLRPNLWFTFVLSTYNS